MRLAIQLKLKVMLKKQSTSKDYCIHAEPSHEKENNRVCEGSQTGTIAELIW